MRRKAFVEVIRSARRQCHIDGSIDKFRLRTYVICIVDGIEIPSRRMIGSSQVTHCDPVEVGRRIQW